MMTLRMEDRITDTMLEEITDAAFAGENAEMIARVVLRHIDAMSFAPLGNANTTERGFGHVSFTDRYGAKCSVQQSSLIGDDDDSFDSPGSSALWVGVDDANPRILASQATQFGVATKETTGWIPYPIPDDILLTTRMHLDRKQVASLIGHLQSWLNTGML